MSAEQIAETMGVGSVKLKPLLYALVIAGLLNVEGDYISNRDAANQYLVKGSPSCVVEIHEPLPPPRLPLLLPERPSGVITMYSHSVADCHK